MSAGADGRPRFQPDLVVDDRSALMQVFVNLATNAVQAMVDTGGGQVTHKAYETDGSGAAHVTDYREGPLGALIVVASVYSYAFLCGWPRWTLPP